MGTRIVKTDIRSIGPVASLPIALAGSKSVFTLVGLLLVASVCRSPSTVGAADDAPASAQVDGVNGYKARQPMTTTSCPDEVSRLRCEVYNSALLEFQSRHALLLGGKATLPETLAAVQRLSNAEVALAGNQATRAKILAAHLALASDLFSSAEEKWEEGVIPLCDRELARQCYLDLKLKAASNDLGSQPQEAQGPDSTECRIRKKILELDVRRAALDLEVAEAEMAENQAINKRMRGAIPPEQMRRVELQVELAKVALERARLMLQHGDGL